MAYVDFMSALHKGTERDYLLRVNDPDFPKATAAELAKRWGYDYWDGDRRVNYGGYHYIEGRWEQVARAMKDHYKLSTSPRILEVGCGKGFLLFDFLKVIPNAKVCGIDVSEWAVEHSHPKVRDRLQVGTATDLPWEDDTFDLVLSINTFHNLYNFELEPALREVERVGKQHKYICVESYRTEAEKANLLYWQVTCETFCTPEEWDWWFRMTGYSGDYSFVYFE